MEISQRRLLLSENNDYLAKPADADDVEKALADPKSVTTRKPYVIDRVKCYFIEFLRCNRMFQKLPED